MLRKLMSVVRITRIKLFLFILIRSIEFSIDPSIVIEKKVK